MSDRELLELAAKAAGIEIFQWVGSVPRLASGDYWEPLTDDGDALRLAVKLGINTQSRPKVAFAYRMGEVGFIETKDGDIYAATRRAIVRAAAAIGAKGEM